MGSFCTYNVDWEGQGDGGNGGGSVPLINDAVMAFTQEEDAWTKHQLQLVTDAFRLSIL
jgi:hypothetical protein